VNKNDREAIAVEKENTYPIITCEETEDGWVKTFDYGKKGKSTVRVHRATHDDGARAELKRFFATLGYELIEE
jgi:hypothetical protein